MADPFDALRLPPVPADPDPEFAGRLRTRLLRAFDLPKGVTVSGLTLETAMEETAPEPALVERASVIPYLAVAGARRAIEWYEEAFGARLRGDPIVMPDGAIGHAELQIGSGGVIMLSEQNPEIGVVAPSLDAGVPVTIHLSVPDVDSLVRRAVSAGARLDREVEDAFYGRNGVIRDPFGHRWLLMTEPAPHPAPRALRHGDVGYASLWVRDARRAALFFSDVLGWHTSPGDRPWGWVVNDLTFPHGINPDHDQPTLFVAYAVGDVGAALEAVRSGGGTAEEPVSEPWGSTAMCTDPEGMEFAVFEPVEGVADPGSAAPEEGSLPGDLAYITMLVRDSTRAREFYGSVLGWRFQPGRVTDGWRAENPVPMTGLSGGNERTFIQPMYHVDDVEAAVARVRALGGTSTDVEQYPYGLTAECEDDQGTRFYLGQLH